LKAYLAQQIAEADGVNAEKRTETVSITLLGSSNKEKILTRKEESVANIECGI